MVEQGCLITFSGALLPVRVRKTGYKGELKMRQTTIFDIDQARIKRDQGLQQVSDNNQRFVTVARETAKHIARRQGTVVMDDVRRECPFEPLHPNAWGSVFRGREWVFTGQYVQSKNVSRKGGMQRVWRLR